MNHSTKGKPSPYTHDQIAAVARALWEEKGRPVGQDVEIWAEAERSLGVKPGKPREDPGFADPKAPLDASGEPTGRVDRRLRDIADAPPPRSPTSL